MPRFLLVQRHSSSGVRVACRAIHQYRVRKQALSAAERNQLDEALRVLFTLMQRAAQFWLLFATMPRRGGANGHNSLLKAERDKVARQLNGLNAALAAFAGTYKRSSRPRRQMSAAARARISAAQKARWAKAKGRKVVPI